MTTRRAPLVTALVLILATVAWVAGVDERIAYDRTAVAAGEWWRLATSSLAHFSTSHLQLNLVGAALVGWRLERESRAHLLGLGVVATLAAAAAVHVLEPDIERYGGLSAVVFAGVIFSALRGLNRSEPPLGRALCAIVVCLLAAKLAIDVRVVRAITGTSGEVRVAAVAHIAAVLSGIALAACVRWRPAGRSVMRVSGALAIASLSACQMQLTSRRGASVATQLSRVVPQSVERADVVELTFPLRTAIIAVADQEPRQARGPYTGTSLAPVDVAAKAGFTRSIAEALRMHPLIASIDTGGPLPSPEGSHARWLLDSLSRSAGVDVVILLGYDQVHYATERWSMIVTAAAAGVLTAVVIDTIMDRDLILPTAAAALSVVAVATLLPLTRIETQTIADVVAYHVRSGRVLFRVPVMDVRSRRVGTFTVSGAHTRQGDESLSRAVEILATTVGAQLTAFETMARRSPQRYRVTTRP